MKTSDFFSYGKSQKLAESLQKTLGRKVDLKSLETVQLEDARNKLRTQVHQFRSKSGFNETVENRAYLEAKMLLDSINAELEERYNESHIVDDQDADDTHPTESKQMKKQKNISESSVQQASAIVTAKNMVDRIDRWIEELSGMENETLLQLGDAIRDEIGQNEAKKFISGVAPQMQETLEVLKKVREVTASSVRGLAGEEQGEMLGADEVDSDDEVDMDVDMDSEIKIDDELEKLGDDDFAAADAAAGGLETAGRAQRESVEYSSRLMKILAG